MSYVPGFEQDLFISHSPIDNKPLAKSEEGWITFFDSAFRALLPQIIGAEAQVVSSETARRLFNCAALISILSPSYIKAESCLEELTKFCQIAEKTGGLRFKNTARIFKVIKTYLPPDNHPQELKGFRGYDFFEMNEQTGRPRELRPELNEEERPRFFAKLYDLVYDIDSLFKELLADKNRQMIDASEAICKTIYLAETTSDLNDVHDQIRRELLNRNCAILPDIELQGLNSNELCDYVRQALGKSEFSIHLIGQHFGIVPEGDTRSLIEIQHELATDRGPKNSRLIWMPPELKTTDSRQREFIDSLRRYEFSPEENVELLETPLDELIAAISHVLRDENNENDDRALSPRGQTLSVYLIYDKVDEQAIRPLTECLRDERFEVELPAFEGDEATRRKAHEGNLQLSDAVLIFCGQTPDAWLSCKKDDVQRTYGIGRAHPLLAQAIYLASPEKDFKKDYQSHEFTVVKNFDRFSPAALSEFISILKRGGG